MECASNQGIDDRQGWRSPSHRSRAVQSSAKVGFEVEIQRFANTDFLGVSQRNVTAIASTTPTFGRPRFGLDWLLSQLGGFLEHAARDHQIVSCTRNRCESLDAPVHIEGCLLLATPVEFH